MSEVSHEGYYHNNRTVALTQKFNPETYVGVLRLGLEDSVTVAYNFHTHKRHSLHRFKGR